MTQEMINAFTVYLQSPSIIVGLSALVLLIAVLISRRSSSKIRQLEKQLRQARSDLRALTTASVGVGGRVLELERRQRRQSEKKPEVVIDEPANDTYDYAIHLAKKGTAIDELVNVCGISRNEAELIQMMHRLKEAS